MAPMKQDPHWVDMLREKHECFGYDNPATMRIDHEGERLEVLLPNYTPPVDILSATRAGHLLYLIGRQKRKVYDELIPVLMVAKRREEGDFEVVVWHEMYPWALKYLNLDA